MNKAAAISCRTSPRRFTCRSSWCPDLPDGLRLLLNPDGGLKAKELPASDTATVLIGPEGGLSDAERTAASAAQFRGLSLGPRILRTETAALAALAIIQQQLGDL